jgi:transcriptional pleiotropic regulator of transition state genes
MVPAVCPEPVDQTEPLRHRDHGEVGTIASPEPNDTTPSEDPLDTFIVRKIDDLGRIVVPAETRRLFNIHEGDELAISVEDGGIVLRKLDSTCIFCEGTEDLRNYHGRGVCVNCRTNLADA